MKVVNFKNGKTLICQDKFITDSNELTGKLKELCSDDEGKAFEVESIINVKK